MVKRLAVACKQVPGEPERSPCPCPNRFALRILLFRARRFALLAEFFPVLAGSLFAGEQANKTLVIVTHLSHTVFLSYPE